MELFLDRTNRFDSTKTITIITFVLGWILTTVATFKSLESAIYFFGIMVASGSGLTFSKGYIDTKQKEIDKDDEQ